MLISNFLGSLAFAAWQHATSNASRVAKVGRFFPIGQLFNLHSSEDFQFDKQMVLPRFNDLLVSVPSTCVCLSPILAQAKHRCAIASASPEKFAAWRFKENMGRWTWKYIM